MLIVPLRICKFHGPSITVPVFHSIRRDHRQVGFSFVSTNSWLPVLSPMLMAASSPKYQLRLYCTSSTFYSPPGAFRSPVVAPCPIEFPPTCEVRVNGMQLTANLKGLKKKPGTAPPPDLGKSVKTAYNQTNRIEMIYVNSQQPTTPKVIIFCRSTWPLHSTLATEVLSRRHVGRGDHC